MAASSKPPATSDGVTPDPPGVPDEKSRLSAGDGPAQAPRDDDSTSSGSQKDGNVAGSAVERPSPPAAAAADEDDGMRGLKLAVVMVGVTLACFLMNLDTTILATAIPRITTQFHSITDIGWYGAAYQLGSASMQPLTGKFYANFNTRITFIVFVAIFEFGSLLCATATSSNMFIIGRAIAGLGTSGIQNGTFTLIANCVPLHRRPSLIGAVQGVSTFGLVVGPLVGGALTEYTTWRWCFYLNLPCGAVVALMVFAVHVPEKAVKPPPLAVWRDLHHRVDLLGFALFAPAVIMLLLAVQWGGNRYPWDSSVVIGLFVGAGANALVWLAWDWHKGDAAMVPLSMLVRRNVWAGALTFGCLMGPMFAASYYLPVYFQSVRGVSPTLSGVYLLPSIASQLVFAVLAGRLLQYVGYYIPFSLLSGVLMSVGYGLTSTLAPRTATSRWVGYQIMFGCGRGVGIQMPLVAIQTNTAPAQIPIALALAFFTATFGGALCLSFADTIFTNSLRSLLRDALPASTVADVVASGGVGFRQLVTPAQLPVVLDAYAVGVDRVFYMLAAWSGLTIFTASAMGWIDIRKKKAKPASKA